MIRRSSSPETTNSKEIAPKRPVLRRLGRAAGVGTIGVVTTLGIDAALQPTLESRAFINTLPATNDKPAQDTLVVFAPGMMSSGELQAAPISDVLTARGDVDFIEQRGATYDAEEVVDEASEFIRDQLANERYKKLTFVATSMGGRTTHDVLTDLHESGDLDGVETQLALVDTPATDEDLKGINQAGAAFKHVPFGPIWNNIPAGPLFVKPIEKSYGEEQATKEQRKAGLDYAQSTTAAEWREQIKYTVQDTPPADSLDFVDDIAYIRSTDDSVVSPVAVQKWEDVAGRPFTVRTVNGPHSGYELNPAGYQAALAETFREFDKK